MSGWPSPPKAFREWPLTDGQMNEAGHFISEPSITGMPRHVYEEAFRIAVELDAVETGRATVRGHLRRQYVRALRKRVRQLVSAPKRAAASSRLEIERAALRYVRYCGGVEHFNITKFVRYVQAKPSAKRVYRSGQGQTLKDHAIRSILKTRLGIVGVRGRKPKKS